MDVMIDTNVIISAALFPNPRINHFLDVISLEHELFLCSYSLEEVDCVFRRKFPMRRAVMEIFLQQLRYTLIHTPSVDILENQIHLRDTKDDPIIASAIVADVDIFITGDKDFDDIDLERPEILTIAEFMEKYV
jgi:putative PIN family toxin of toxin-antitoxin system